MSYLRNTWYAAGWSRELAAGELLARTFLDEPVVLFRDASGAPKALADRCPHRFAPLSMGRLCDSGAALALFASEAVRRGKLECTQEGETVWSRRFITDDRTPPDFLYEAFQVEKGKPIDRWLDVRWNAPALMALWTGGVASGQPREEGVVTPTAHFFTPESSSRTHYFYAISFRRVLGPAADEMAREGANVLRGPFEHEDKPMIEAVARRMSGAELWSLRPILLSGDAAAVRARRVLQALLAKGSAELAQGTQP